MPRIELAPRCEQTRLDYDLNNALLAIHDLNNLYVRLDAGATTRLADIADMLGRLALALKEYPGNDDPETCARVLGVCSEALQARAEVLVWTLVKEREEHDPQADTPT